MVGYRPAQPPAFDVDNTLHVLDIKRLSLTYRQTVNGKNETFAVCPPLSVQ